jgi:hypothetical protein
MPSRIGRVALAPVALAWALGLAPLPARDASATPPPAPDWEVEIAPYGWFSLTHGQVETPLGTEEFTIDAHDVIDSIDLGAMGAVKLRWKRWVALFDVAWAKLSTKDEIQPRNTQVSFDLTQKLGWFETLAGYRVYEKPGGLFGAPAATDRRIFAFDAMGGFTYSWSDTRLKVSRDPGLILPAQNRTVKSESDWVAPYLGFRFTNDFTDSFGLETLLGVGGFGIGDAPHVSWQATSQLSYDVSERVSLLAGFRALGFRNPDVKATFYGPIIGVSFRFSGGQ